MCTISRLWATLVGGILVAAIVATPATADKSRRSRSWTVGIPYTSVTSYGDFFSGAVRIDRFEVDGQELKAVGALLKGRRVYETEFPVEVVEASCDQLQLKIGPPDRPATSAWPALTTPLSVVQTPPSSELRQADFCGLALAFAADDLELLADRLNERQKIEAGVLGSCPWYKQIECAFAVNSCRTICTLFTPANPLCIQCFEDLNAGSCIKCYVP